MRYQGLRAPALKKVAAALLGGGLALLGSTGVTAASPFALYRVLLTPTTIQQGLGTFKVSLTDCGIVAGVPACSGLTPTFDSMHSATIGLDDAIPSLTSIRSLTPSTWTAALDSTGKQLTLTSSSSLSDLTFGQSVSVTIDAPTVVGADGIHTSALDSQGQPFNEMGTDPSLTVVGPPVSLTFTTEPGETALNTPFAQTVQVSARDQAGHGVPAVPIALALGPSSDPLSGNNANTNDSGVASFPGLEVGPNAKVPGFNFTLIATTTDGNLTASSTSFTIASATEPCQGSCDLKAADGAGTTSTDANVNGSSQQSQLFITMYNPATGPNPSNACGSVAPKGSGSDIDLNSNPNFAATTRTLTWTLDHSLVNADADLYKICLGAVNLANPSQSAWITQSGSPAIQEPDGKYWGIARSQCDVDNPPQPCLLSQGLDSAGNLVIRINIPAGWDESLIGGLPRV